MFRKILIANRGEIAVRIIRACRDMGIISVAVYSSADADALHTQLADESVCIGPARSAESYLNMQAVISAAVVTGAQAIHPGFGFLSENAAFAKLCAENGIVFIGPSPATISMLGDKACARETMREGGVPIIPGSSGPVKDAAAAARAAGKIGYPVMIKAAAGGGGRGIRVVSGPKELEKAFAEARAEAQSCFGDGALYVEKCIKSPRHIEFQILADTAGNTLHLFERDCSIQRRHQKILEESPSPFLTPRLREKMGRAAVKAAKAAGYVNAGTVEFLVDEKQNFYFCEMNTRIQVEHPVTELVTNIDLVEWQIRIAEGQRLTMTQEDIRLTGHAIECRINAEDPARGFAPSPGLIQSLNVPGGPGVRVDSGIYQGYSVPPHYDSMLAKLIVHGDSRAAAIARMKRAMSEFIIEGVATNTDYQLAILKDADFMRGDCNVDFLETHRLF